jgi:predicted acetyltransferase
VLIVCEAGNVGSARTIEGHGAIPEEISLEEISLEEIRETTHGSFRRYWIML